jgi:hypothetical protein
MQPRCASTHIERAIWPNVDGSKSMGGAGGRLVFERESVTSLADPVRGHDTSCRRSFRPVVQELKARLGVVVDSQRCTRHAPRRCLRSTPRATTGNIGPAPDSAAPSLWRRTADTGSTNRSKPCASNIAFNRGICRCKLLILKWCGRKDLNLHDLAIASPSSWCVCQFRHFRKWTCRVATS